MVRSSTRTPQETILSPFTSTDYTPDFCFSSGKKNLQKLSDESSNVGCITEDKEDEDRDIIRNFMRWCDRNHPQGKPKSW